MNKRCCIVDSLQPYPADDDVELMSCDGDSYRHVKQCLEQITQRSDRGSEADGRGRRQLKVVSLLDASLGVLLP